MTLLDRTIAAADCRLVLLAPARVELPTSFRNVTVDRPAHRRLLESVQRFRGGVYQEDGAIAREELTGNGLHKTPEDEESWHLVSLNDAGRVVGCAWYRLHGPTAGFDDLRVRHTPVAGEPVWRERLWYSVERDLLQARREGIGYAELGGWAISKEHRGSSEILLLACGAYALSQALGDALGLATATVRHSSAGILRRLGGERLPVHGEPRGLPPYFDPQYGCTMELLRFDSRKPHPGLLSSVGEMRQKFSTVSVLQGEGCAIEHPARPETRLPDYSVSRFWRSSILAGVKTAGTGSAAGTVTART